MLLGIGALTASFFELRLSLEEAEVSLETREREVEYEEARNGGGPSSPLSAIQSTANYGAKKYNRC